MAQQLIPDASQFEVCFEPLIPHGRSLSFPCDPEGHVDLDHASERARNDYLFARTLVGRDFARPTVRPASLH